MDALAESALKKLLADWDNLQKNTFWLHFIEEVQNNRLASLVALGSAINRPESEVRAAQGRIQAFDALLDLPEYLANLAQDKLTGQSETTPGDDYE